MKRQALRVGLGLALALGLVLACQSEYVAAGVGLGAAVTGAGINRAITGGCWAVCSPGFACDRARGVCVRAECLPACRSIEQCVIEQDGRSRCLEISGGMQITAPSPAAPAPSRDAGVDAASD